MSSPRLIAAAICTVAAIVAALYLAGFGVRALLGVDTAGFGVGTWIAYVRVVDHPQVAPYAWRIWLAGGLAGALMLLMWLAVMVMLFKLRSHRNLHGRARFAGLLDLARAGFLRRRDDGIIVGRHWGRLLRLSGQQFVVLAAPTRSGKGVGVVIPNLLDYRESAVVLDIKQENFELTSGWRASIGHEIHLFNPFAEDRRTHRWNPLTYVSADPDFRVSDLQAIAAMLYPTATTRTGSGSARRATRSSRSRSTCSSGPTAMPSPNGRRSARSCVWCPAMAASCARICRRSPPRPFSVRRHALRSPVCCRRRM